jgi:hypothetical protein
MNVAGYEIVPGYEFLQTLPPMAPNSSRPLADKFILRKSRNIKGEKYGGVRVKNGNEHYLFICGEGVITSQFMAYVLAFMNSRTTTPHLLLYGLTHEEAEYQRYIFPLPTVVTVDIAVKFYAKSQ